MKKVSTFMIVIILVLTFGTGLVMGATKMEYIEVALNSVKVVVNGKTIDAPNIVYDGRTYVPMNAVSTALGENVQWNANTREVIIGKSSSIAAPVTVPKPLPVPAPTAKYPTVNDIAFSFNFLPPDSIGTYYIEATYKNNSSFTIKSVNLQFLDKDINDKYYLSSYDVVKPGEISPKFETFAPKSGEAGMQKLKIEIRYIGIDGKDDHWVTYDYKLGTYETLN